MEGERARPAEHRCCPWDHGDRDRPPACPEKHGRLGPATTSARRPAVTSRAPGNLGRNRCRSATERATAVAARLAPDAQQPRAAGGGSECKHSDFAAATQPRGLWHREPLPWEHRWRPQAPGTVFRWGKGHLPSISHTSSSESRSWTLSRFVLKRIPCVFERLLCAARGKRGVLAIARVC